MQIFVTNLPWSTERRKSITSQLDRLGLPYEMPACTIGRDLTQAEIAERCNLDVIRQWPWFTPGIIGCTLTCLSIYRLIVERGLPCALYLEDDAIVPDELPELLARLEEELVDGEVALLYYVSDGLIELSRSGSVALTGRYSLRYPMDLSRLGSGSAFAVTAGAARRMLHRNTPIEVAPDSWGFFRAEGCLTRVRCVHPMPIDTADFKSTLDYRHGSTILGAVAQAVDQYAPAPLRALVRRRRRVMRQRRQECTLTDAVSPLAPPDGPR